MRRKLVILCSIAIIIMSFIFPSCSFANQEKMSSDKDNIIPEKFDLRDKINIIVENQKNYGLCWAFASLKCLETNLALHGYGDYDFSELHLDYLESEEFGTNFTLHNGRNFSEFEDYVINGYGPVLETEVPYDTKYTIDDYEYLYNLKSKVYVNDTINFSKIDKVHQEYSKKQLNSFRDKVKKHIMENGSIYATIACKSTNTDFLSSTIDFYNEKHVLNYQNENCQTEHAISIIGWDDNFSKENFPESCRPSSNGAYIALNSWGEEWGEKGIFYISYEDNFVETNMCGVTEASISKENLHKIELKDKDLYNAIKDYLGKSILKYDDSNCTIYTSKLVIDNLKKLQLWDNNITNLKGLENFYNLAILDLSNNKIEDISSLKSLKNIKELYLNNNNITDITYLQELTDLYKIEFKNNSITNIDGIINLENLKYIDLSYNNIKDIGDLKNFEYEELNLSGNNLNVFPNKTYGANKIYFENCNLDDNDVNKICEKLGILRNLSLKNNNITDLNNIICQYDKERGLLDLSGNKNIDLKTINKIKYIPILNLSDCNISDVSIIKENFWGSNLDLSKNPIENIDIFENENNLYSLNISYTNIKSIPNLPTIAKLDISGLGKIKGLSIINNLIELRMNDCDLNDEDLKEIVESNTKLETLYVNNNDITNLDSIHIKKIKNLYLSQNKITDISKLQIESYIEMLDLSNNLIDSRAITYLKKLNYSDLATINLSDNNIENCDDLFNNEGATSRYWPYVNKVLNNIVVNKNIDIEKDKENTILAPRNLFELFKQSLKNKNIKFICENCKMNFTATKIYLNSNKLGKGQAKIIVRDGITDRYVYILNYNIVEKLNVTEISVTGSYKKYYIEGERIDTSGLMVEVTYENGLKEVSEDYTILNGNKLLCEKEVIIRSNRNPEIETILPIKVYAESEKVEMHFNDDNICKAILNYFDDIGKKVIILGYDEKEKIMIMPKEFIDSVTQLDLNNNNIKDITGLENFINLEYISLSYNNLKSVDNIFDLKRLKNIIMYNTDVIDISGLLLNKNVGRISMLNKNSIFLKGDSNKIELPNFIYQSLTMQENIENECTIYYSVKMNAESEAFIESDSENKKIEIKIDTEKQKAVVDLDDVIKENNNIDIIGIDVNIKNGKTADEYTYFYNLKCDHNFENGVCKNCGEKILKDSSLYNIIDSKIKGISPNSTYESIKININNKYQTKLLDSNKKETEDKNIKTGMFLRITENNNNIADYLLIVKGDVTEDGKADIKDILLINKHRLNKVNLKNEALDAGDVNADGIVDIKDILQINKFRFGKINSL